MVRIFRLMLVLLYTYTGCPGRNVPDFERMFLILNYTDITQNIYIQSWTVTEIMAREVWKYDSCYTLTDYQIHIKMAGMCGFYMLISVLNIKLTCEWHKAIKLNYINIRINVAVVLRVPSTIHMQSQRECTWAGCRLNDVHAQCMGNTSREPGTVRGTARRPHFSLAIISITVQLRV
jgi:hypothetical protein